MGVWSPEPGEFQENIRILATSSTFDAVNTDGNIASPLPASVFKTSAFLFYWQYWNNWIMMQSAVI